MKQLTKILLSAGLLFAALSSCSGQGAQGPKGDPGTPGINGKDGADGVDGKDGAAGKDGASLLTGEGEPSDELGQDGDTYIDTLTGAVYKNSGGTWGKTGQYINVHNPEYDPFIFVPNGDGTYSVGCDYAYMLETINIPSSYYGAKVTGVINLSPVNRENVSTKSVFIPNTVTSVKGYGGGYYFESLETIRFSPNTKSLGEGSLRITRSTGTLEETKPFWCVIPKSVETIESNAVIYRYWNEKFENKASLYCEATSMPEGWSKQWGGEDFSVYWYSEAKNADGFHWHYVDGMPAVWVE